MLSTFLEQILTRTPSAPGFRSEARVSTVRARLSVANVVVAVCVLGVVALSYWRLFYGIDFTDESWYVGIAYRFVLGGKPYVEETSVQQTTTAVLLYPFLWTYHLVAGRTGLVLFVRQLHFLLSLGVGSAVFVSLRRLLGARAAALLAVGAFVFAPFDIPSVSYDSVGSGLFTAGCLLGYLARRDPRARVPAGVCLGLAAFAYPPLILGVIAACAVGLMPARVRRRGDVTRLVVPAIGLPLVGMAALAAVSGAGAIVADYRRTSHFTGQAGGLGKLQEIATHEWSTFPYWYVALAALAVLLLAWRRQPLAAAGVVAILPVAFLPPHPGSYAAGLEYVAHLGWLAVPLFAGLRRDRDAAELFRLVWVPALVGGITTAYSSGNGGVNFAVGFLPAALVAVALTVRAVETLAPGRWEAGIAPAAIAGALLVVFSLIPVYRDGSLGTLDARVHSGPYAGLITTEKKRGFLGELTGDLGTVSSRCRIAFFADFPAGYLLTGARIDTNGLWLTSVSEDKTFAYRESVVRYYARHGLPDVVVLMNRIPFDPPRSARAEHYRPGDPLLVMLRRGSFRPMVKRYEYTVYRRDACTA